MRNQCRLMLLLRLHSRSQPRISSPFSGSHFQVHATPSFRRFSSQLHSPARLFSLTRRIPECERRFSTAELTVEGKCVDDSVILTDIFTDGTKTSDEIKLELESNNVVIDYELVLRVLKNVSEAPDVARRFFDWVSEYESKWLNSQSYNLLLSVLGANGFVKEFWDVVEIMEKKGYGVSSSTHKKISAPDVARSFSDWVLDGGSERLSSKSHDLMLLIFGKNGFVEEFWRMIEIMEKKGYRMSKSTCDRVSVTFQEKNLDGDVEKLKELVSSGCVYSPIERACVSEVSKVIHQQAWGDAVENSLRELISDFSSDLVAAVLENLATEPNKALIFFRWIEENGLFKHDQLTYNAMAKVLGREDCIDKLWRVLNDMRDAGHELEKQTYVNLFSSFVNRKMMIDAVDLYEFAMGGKHKPAVQDCTHLLKKITVAKELNLDLFSRVIRVFKESGNVLNNTALDAVLKSLTSVGRLGDSSKIFKAMEEGGALPSDALMSKVAFRLSSGGKMDEIREFVDNMEASGSLNHKTWVSLIEGCCVDDDLDKASDYFLKMIEKEGTFDSMYPLAILINEFCRMKRPIDAFKLISDVVNQKELKPWHSTYKSLLEELLISGCFQEALSLMGLMKTQGYPPFLDAFVKYISKTGTADDAAAFMKAMTVKKFPSTAVYLRVFEAYAKARRHDQARDFLCKCPRHIRNHPDVLNLLYAMASSSSRVTTTAALTA